MTQKEHKNHPNNIHNVVGKDRRVAKKIRGFVTDRRTDFWSWELFLWIKMANATQVMEDTDIHYMM